MKEKYYTINTNLKKKLLKKYVNNQNGYKNWSVIGDFFKILSVVLFIAMIYILVIPELGTEYLLRNLAVALGVGLVFLIVFFTIGYAIKTHGICIYGQPYFGMVRENILISENEVKLIYHNLENENSNSIDLYEIPKENINAVIYNKEYHFVEILGEARLISYDDIEMTIINEKNSQRKFYHDSPFEIMLAFDEEEEIVSLLKGMAKTFREE